MELDALVKQIQGVMTSEQLQAIDAMDLTDQVVSGMMQSLGIDSNGNASASTPIASALSQAGPSGGQGGMPGGGGDSVMNAIGSGVTIASTPATTQPTTSTQTTQVDARLLYALIQMLETRSQTSE